MIISSKFKSFFMFYLPILVWMGFIFFLSGVPNLKIGTATLIEFIFRKVAHFSEYAILSYLFVRAFSQVNLLNSKKSYYISFLGAFLFSLSDEFHQLFVIGRSGNLFDVGIDSVGIIFGLIIFHYYSSLLINKKR